MELYESRPIPRRQNLRPRMADVPCFFHRSVSSFAFLSRVRDLETADRVRCNYPPSGRRGRSVPLASLFVRSTRSLLRGERQSRVCSPIRRRDEARRGETSHAAPRHAGGEHSVHSSSAGTHHGAFPIPRADGHRQSETTHEILHGENLRVPAAFPLIRTRGNRPFRSRGERGPRPHDATQHRPHPRPRPRRCLCIDSLGLSFSSPFLFHRRRVLPFVPSSFGPRDFRAFPPYTPFVSLSSLLPLTLSLSLSISISLLVSLSCIRARGHDHTLCTARHRHPQGGQSFVWYSTLTARYFRADLHASLIPTTSYSVYVPVHRLPENSPLASDPTGWDLRTYVPCTEENIFPSAADRLPPSNRVTVYFPNFQRVKLSNYERKFVADDSSRSNFFSRHIHLRNKKELFFLKFNYSCRFSKRCRTSSSVLVSI